MNINEINNYGYYNYGIDVTLTWCPTMIVL